MPNANSNKCSIGIDRALRIRIIKAHKFNFITVAIKHANASILDALNNGRLAVKFWYFHLPQ